MSASRRIVGLMATAGAGMLAWAFDTSAPHALPAAVLGAAAPASVLARPPAGIIRAGVDERAPTALVPKAEPGNTRFDRPDAPQPPTADPLLAAGKDAAGPCDTDVRISGLLYDRDEPARSFAVLRSGEWAGGRTVGVGSRIGERRVVEIMPRAVRLRDSGSVCWVGMFTPQAREKVAKERAAARGARNAKGRAQVGVSKAQIKAGIVRIDDLNYRVQRSLLERAWANPTKLASAMRLQPVRERGRVVGMKVGTLPRSSLLPQLGVRAGDVLRTLNGYPVADRAVLRTAHAALARSSRISLTLERDRRLHTFSYRLE